MARAIWSGAINFGLVTVPVELYSATEDHTVHFRQFERGTSDRIRYRRVNERTGKEVEFGDIVKGYDLGDGEYVLVEQDELDEIAPGRSRSIDIEAFVELDDIDPIFFQKSYWLAPSKEEFGRAYGLLVQAMDRTNKAGVARFVMRGKEQIAAIRAGEDGVLILDTLLFAEDLRDPAKELRKLPSKTEARGRELDMAVSLIDSMTEDWHPEDYHDTYTERVHKLIDDKKAGRKVSVEAPPSEPTKVVDLFEALSRSVESRKGGRKKASSSGSSKKKAPDLSGLSKAELDKMARELDVKGRSKMSRAELEKAVGEAQGSRKRAS
ncbi:DNA end-binding protein Ku [Amycolatopsis bartoniae]|uniref:Non-homologous end joining protein Ku n=1 Tax=Amycolatopsis bartoniae TaxID=941986 RepID=A0A8H9MC03_9PSEU|nr:Ku protein [Amycolatopsis bartoniae]MBB2933448.1 DNA end-binding protein Ku [Amycolatopsis bartoniae]TVT00416.1 Ku protein [Amycolatopsis bartoniae]GHF59525.1 non-homologous end joining protein Ku [Amycolatopsis bartoniae]